jgi:hypothetical protein
VLDWQTDWDIEYGLGDDVLTSDATDEEDEGEEELDALMADASTTLNEHVRDDYADFEYDPLDVQSREMMDID